MKIPLFLYYMEKESYLNEIKCLLNEDKLDFFKEEIQIISDVFYKNGVEVKSCFNFFKLILETRNLLYKYNLHLDYEPFKRLDKVDLNWQSFRISDGTQTKLEVFYNRDYSLMRIEDNISALFY